MRGTSSVTSTSGRDFYNNTVVEAVTFTDDTTGGIFQKKKNSASQYKHGNELLHKVIKVT